MTDEHPHWFSWSMDDVAIRIKVHNGAVLRHYQVRRDEIGVFDSLWSSLVSKGYVEVAFAEQEETR